MTFDPITVRELTMEETLSYKGVPVLKYTIRYPEFSSAVFRIAVHEMNRYYFARAALQRQRNRQLLYPQAVRDYEYAAAHDYPFRQYEAVMVHTVTYNENCVL